MTIFEWIQQLILLGTAIFVAGQVWMLRKSLDEQRAQIKEQQKQLRIQSIFQIWFNHIQTNHLLVATSDKEKAEYLNQMTPYHELDIDEARKAHYADAILDQYECIHLMSDLGIVDEEVARIWKESIPYELKNPNLNDHWKINHRQTDEEGSGIYHRSFSDLIDNLVDGDGA